MYKNIKKLEKGFTLVELILVIAIIIIIAAAIFVALNPARRIGDANDSRRWSDVNQILNAVHQSNVDAGGAFPDASEWTAGANYYVLGTGAACNVDCGAQTTQAACADLASLVSGSYIASIPQDPVTGTAAHSDYYVNRTAGGIVTVGVCDPYSGAISASR